MKKGQVAVEFMFFIGMGVLLFVIFSIISMNYLQNIYKDKQNIDAQGLTDILRNEINLAGRAENGYHTEYFLPPQVSGKDYILFIDGRELDITVGTTTYIGRLATDIMYAVAPPCSPQQWNSKTCYASNKKLIITKSGNEVHLSYA